MTKILRPFLPLLGGVAVAAMLVALRGLGSAEMRWVQIVAGIQLLCLPFSAAAALLLGVLTRRVEGARVQVGAFALGLAMILVQEASLWTLPETWIVPVGTGLVAVAGLLVLGWARAQGGTVAPRAGRRALASSLLALTLLPAGLLLSHPPARIGAVAVVGDGRPLPAPDAPNLVLIVLDTLRADHLSCMGYERPTTPQLDALAARGMLFRNAHSTATHTAPSHSSMFTGLLPSEHGVMSALVPLPLEPDTLAEKLRESGWNTAGVSSNFVVRRSSGFHRGFDYFDDTLTLPRGLGAATIWVTAGTGMGRVLGRLPFFRHYGFSKLFTATFLNKDNVHAGQTNARALAALDLLEARERPYFLFLNYMDAHAPYSAPGAARERFLEHDPGVFTAGMQPRFFHGRVREIEEGVLRGEKFDEEIGALVDLYDGEIANMDAQLPVIWDRVLRQSAATGRDTLLIVVADHGEMFAEHGHMTHGRDLWEECLHVPFIVAGSKIQPAVVDEPVSTLDLAGTFLAAAGLPPIGRSQDLLAGFQRPAGHVLAEDGQTYTVAHHDPLNGVAFYFGRLKATFAVDEARKTLEHQQSFDLAADPAERTSLGEDALRGFLDWQAEWWRAYLAGRARRTTTALTAADRQSLAELGYAEGQ